MMSFAAQRRRSANEISRIVLNCAMQVHSALGPGLLESAYQACLAQELRKAGLTVDTEVPIPLVYDGLKLEVGYRMDLLVEDSVVVEVKSIEALAPIHQAQILPHLKVSGKSLGLLINFNVVQLKTGIKRCDGNRLAVMERLYVQRQFGL